MKCEGFFSHTIKNALLTEKVDDNSWKIVSWEELFCNLVKEITSIMIVIFLHIEILLQFLVVVEIKCFRGYFYLIWFVRNNLRNTPK